MASPHAVTEDDNALVADAVFVRREHGLSKLAVLLGGDLLRWMSLAHVNSNEKVSA